MVKKTKYEGRDDLVPYESLLKCNYDIMLEIKTLEDRQPLILTAKENDTIGDIKNKIELERGIKKNE